MAAKKPTPLPPRAGPKKRLPLLPPNAGPKKPIRLPPTAPGTGTPNPVQNPDPAGNRNTTFQKPGAILPFPNPNKDLAVQSGLLQAGDPGAPTSGEVSASNFELEGGRPVAGPYVPDPYAPGKKGQGGLPPLVPGAPDPYALSKADVLPRAQTLGSEDPYTGSEDWLQDADNPNMVGIRNKKTGEVRWVNRYDPDSIRMAKGEDGGGVSPGGGLPPLVSGTPGGTGVSTTTPPGGEPVAKPPGTPDPYAPGKEGEEKIIGGRLFEFAGGKWVPLETPAGGPGAKPSGTSEPPPEEVDPDLKVMLDRAFAQSGGRPENAEAYFVSFAKDIAKRRGEKDWQKYVAQAKTYLATYKSNVATTEKTKALTGKLDAIVKESGLDALGLTGDELGRLSSDQLFGLYNEKDSKVSDTSLRTLLENWQSQRPGQKIPVPTDTTSRAYQFYQAMRNRGKADALFAPAITGSAGAVTPQQITDYLGRLSRSEKLPRTADEAYTWLEQPLDAPPGLVKTEEGWANADGSPPTPEQQAALNRYVARLNTQDADREAAYGLIAAQNGQPAADAARQKDFENDQKLQEQRDKAAQERAVTADERAATEGVIAARRLEDMTIRGEERDKLTKIAQEGRDAAKRVRERASGATPALADATAQYRVGLTRFSRVPTTLEEAKEWLGQTLAAPPGLMYDETTRQWVDESGNLPTFDRAQAVQDYEFQQSQYAQNRKKADGIIQSYASLDDALRATTAADEALQKALGTADVIEQVEMAYLKDKAALEYTRAQTKHQQTLTFVELTNNPAMAARLKALGLLDQFSRDTGLNIVVPDKMDRGKIFSMIPSLGDWSKMNPQQQMDALEMLSAKTGWMPEELAALMSETAGAPGGGRSGGVSESTIARSR